MRRPSSIPLLLLLSLLFTLLPHPTCSFSPSTYDVDWTSPSTLETQSMPLGNGDLTLSVWVNASTADLMYYVQTASAYEENGQLLKTIRGRLSLGLPAPVTVTSFHQHLHLLNASQTVSFTANGVNVSALLWVDRFHPTVHVQLSSSTALNVSNGIEMWRTTTTRVGDNWVLGYYCEDRLVYPDVLYRGGGFGGGKGELLWWHRNDGDAANSLYSGMLQQQYLQGVGLEAFNPLVNRTFGGYVLMDDAAMYSQAVVAKEWYGLSATLQSMRPVSSVSFSVVAHTEERGTPDEWRSRVQLVAQEVSSIPLAQRMAAHTQWWAQFHNRSYVDVRIVANATLSYRLTQNMLLQRTQDAMDGYSAYPIHFNGQGWNVGSYAESPQGPDHRQWGSGFWWQNTREAYYPAAPSGDWDLLLGMFGFYQSIAHVQETRVREYYGHTGTFFEETITMTGLPSNGYFGWTCGGTVEHHMNDNIRYHWDGSLELCLLMVQYYQFTHDATFLSSTLLPMCNAITSFFYNHYPQRDAANHTVFFPSQSLETWECPDSNNNKTCPTNSIIFVAGLQATLGGLLSLPPSLTPDDDRARWLEQYTALPPLPSGPCPRNQTLHCLWPAQAGWTDGNVGNSENVELYTVWPYGLYGLSQPDYATALTNYLVRPFPCNTGWCQDLADAAYLGLRNDTAQMTIERVTVGPADGWRFPSFSGPFQDSIPNEDHYSVVRTAMIAMLMQEVQPQAFDLRELRRNRGEGGVYVVDEEAMKGKGRVGAGETTVLLMFGAIPDGWDASFKLWASGPTIIEGQCSNGTLTALSVTPAERRADIVLAGCTNKKGSVFEGEGLRQEGRVERVAMD